WFVFVVVGLFLLRLGWVGAQAGQVHPGQQKAGVTAWDTRLPSAPEAAAARASKQAWIKFPPGQLAAAFQEDAVLSNGRIAAVVRKQSATVDFHAVKPDGMWGRLRLRLLAASGEPSARLERVTLVENTKGSACLEASFRTAKGADVTGRFRLKRDA